VREDGPPSRLPNDDDFSGHRAGLGQTYEAAWLVFRLLGERYGDAAVVAFYDAVVAGDGVDRALAEQVGVTRDELTAAWRAYLVCLAGRRGALASNRTGQLEPSSPQSEVLMLLTSSHVCARAPRTTPPRAKTATTMTAAMRTISKP
jgi:hypothetical protein